MKMEIDKLEKHTESTMTYSCRTQNKRGIDIGIEPPLMPPNRDLPLEEKNIDDLEEGKEEESRGFQTSSASSTGSFMQAAATPPRLTRQESGPGAVRVPGIGFDNDLHDNIIDMDYDTRNSNSNEDSVGIDPSTPTRRSDPASTIQSPGSNSFTYFDQSTPGNISSIEMPMSTPIDAELAPAYSYSEQDVENLFAARIEAQIQAEISTRLQQAVDLQISEERRQHAVAVVLGNDNDYMDNKGMAEEDKNFKICGIRRTWWGMILCTTMLVIVAGVGGAYLKFSESMEGDDDSFGAVINATNDTTNANFPSIYPTFSPNLKPTPLATSSSPSSTEIPIVNLTTMPTSAQGTSSAPSAKPSMAPNADQRRNYLMANIGRSIVPEDFADFPETYFEGNSYSPQNNALDWMANIDLGSDIFTMPVKTLVERYVIAVLYYSTGGYRTWDEPLSFLSSSHVCDWKNDHSIQKVIVGSDFTTQLANESPNFADEATEYNIVSKGVFCNKESLFVTNIEMPRNSLQGRIPWELSLLENLTKINFDVNELYGNIPVELSRLRKLQKLWFNNNTLTGKIPTEFSSATELESVDFEGNNLNSTLPSEWGSLSNLSYVGLRMNNIVGTLPSEWRALNNLATLDLGGNLLVGTIPEEYSDLSQLEYLYLESNRLEGSLPRSFGNLTNLLTLFVDDNQLSGTVPTEYSGLADLEYFWLDHNFLTGSVDDTFCDYSKNPWFESTDLKSNCLAGGNPGSAPAQIECSCCTECCDSNGTNCAANPIS